jgi:hypothetical protein
MIGPASTRVTLFSSLDMRDRFQGHAYLIVLLFECNNAMENISNCAVS